MTRIPARPLLVGAGLLAAGLLGITGTGTLSSITAQVTHGADTNRVGLGRLVMEVKNAAGTCLSSAGTGNAVSCTDVKPLSGNLNLIPGQTVTTTVTVTNTGSVTPTSFTLGTGACSPIGTVSGSTTATAQQDICNKVQIAISNPNGQNQTTSYTGTSLAQQTLSLTPLAAGQARTITFAVTTDSGLSNDYQGLGISMPMTWTFTQ